MSKKLYLPGDFITIIEEFFPGEGIFEEKGKLYASLPGILKSDLKERRVNLEFLRLPKSYAKKGDVIIARVNNIGRNLIELSAIFNETRSIPMSVEAYMFLKRLEDEVLYDFIKPTDFVRARVINSEGNLLLSIRGKEYGIIYAECPNCMNPLYYNENEPRTLRCLECGHAVKTKVSTHYVNRITKEEVKH